MRTLTDKEKLKIALNLLSRMDLLSVYRALYEHAERMSVSKLCKCDGIPMAAEHCFEDDDNEGVYGYETCRYCGLRQKKE